MVLVSVDGSGSRFKVLALLIEAGRYRACRYLCRHNSPLEYQLQI